MNGMNNIIDEVNVLQLPIGKYAVISGGSLSVRGIREHGDVDVVVTADLYEQLKNDGSWEEVEKRPGSFGLQKGNYEVLPDFTNAIGCALTVEEVIENADVIEGVPFMSLDDVVKLKEAMGREKDMRDLELIREYRAQSKR